jgi:hypothetical protein
VRPSSKQVWTGIVVALVLLALLLAALDSPGYPLAGHTLGTAVLPPALVATAVYARTHPDVPWWQLGVLVVWGFISMLVAFFIGFLAIGMDGGGTATAVGSPTATEYLVSSIKFTLIDTVALSLVYWIAARLRATNRSVSLGVLVGSPVLAGIATIVQISLLSII